MIERNRSCSASLIALVRRAAGPARQLQIREVERRLAILRLGVGGFEAGEQLLQELPVARSELLESNRPHGLPRVAERRCPRAPRGRRRKLDQALRQPGRLEEVERVTCGVALWFCRLLVCQKCLDLGEQFHDRVVEARAHYRLEHQLRARPTAACRRR